MRKIISLLSVVLFSIINVARSESLVDYVKNNTTKDCRPASDGDKCIGTSGTHA